jgi:hypothetical protein
MLCRAVMDTEGPLGKHIISKNVTLLCITPEEVARLVVLLPRSTTVANVEGGSDHTNRAWLAYTKISLHVSEYQHQPYIVYIRIVVP